jgi:hypothetical protein
LIVDRHTGLLNDQAVLATSRDTEATAAQDEIVRIVEFETPAQILCGAEHKNLVSEKYKLAYFDLVSTGFEGSKQAEAAADKKSGQDKDTGTTLHLRFRIVGPPAHQKGFTDLTISLFTHPDTAKPMTIPISLQNRAGEFTIGIQIVNKRPRVTPPPLGRSIA